MQKKQQNIWSIQKNVVPLHAFLSQDYSSYVFLNLVQREYSESLCSPHHKQPKAWFVSGSPE